MVESRMAPEDRDRTFEKALARHLRPGEQPEACPDADTLAAYHELELPAEERFHWKMHILACARCQEILVQLQDTDHIPTGVGRQRTFLSLTFLSWIRKPFQRS